MLIATTIDARQSFCTFVRKNNVWVYTENMLRLLASKTWVAGFSSKLQSGCWGLPRNIHVINVLLKKGVIIMRTISTTIAAGTLVFFMSTQVWASDAGHTSEAMEHAGKAQAHGEMGHAKDALQHAKDSLAHAKASRDDHAASHKHMDEAIKHLEEAIKHADMGHGPESAKHAEEAMKHMRQSGH